MHNNQVSDDFATPVPCLADPNLIAYDTSISNVSGLQVPARMVDTRPSNTAWIAKDQSRLP